MAKAMQAVIIRDEKAVTARQFGDQEDRGQGSLHHARHHARHTYQGERNQRQVPSEQGVADQRRDSAHECADEQRRGERTADAARSVGRGHGDHLEEHRAYDEENDHPVDLAETVEERVVE